MAVELLSQEVSGGPDTSNLFRPKTLKRKNLKHLTLQPAASGDDSPKAGSTSPLEGSVGSNVTRKQPTLEAIASLNRDTSLQSISVLPGSSSASDMSSITSGTTPTMPMAMGAAVSVSAANVGSGMPQNHDETATLTTQIARLSLTPENGIQLENLVRLSKIGAGNSGTVVKTLHVPDSSIIAKKTIPVENKEVLKNQLVRELTIMKNVKAHDNIVGFYGAFYDPSTTNEIVILMEYMDCGSLDKILTVYRSDCQRKNLPISCKTSWFNEMTLSRISYCVLNGLIYLYDNYKIIHRDIKPSNILISSKGSVKICDFGVSTTLINSLADTFVGTSTYMSPERIQGGRYTTKGDVWSLGLMIIELSTGEFPLGGHHDTPEGILDLLQRIVNEPAPRLPKHEHFSIQMTDFVNRCCIKEERGRSSLKELICHDFICKYNTRDTIAKEFRHWCKKVKKRIKEDKMIKREESERNKAEKRQLEKAALAVTAARSSGSVRR
ncbi:Serine/threonine-protein kinase STE7 [Kluyveromyces marxianus]